MKKASHYAAHTYPPHNIAALKTNFSTVLHALKPDVFTLYIVNNKLYRSVCKKKQEFIL